MDWQTTTAHLFAHISAYYPTYLSLLTIAFFLYLAIRWRRGHSPTTVWRGLFASDYHHRHAIFALLYLLGVAHWLLFFNYGEMSGNALDWPKEYAYYDIWQQALAQQRIPYHISQPFQGTDRFLGIPETLFSPQLLLLPLLGTTRFMLCNILLLYSVGFIGCLLLQRRYQLAPWPFAVLVLLFTANGYITSHLAAGHSMWCGYFLLPFFVLFVLEMIEGRQCWTAIKLALLLFVLLLQGSLHVYVWCLIFLALLAGFRRQYALVCCSAVAISAFLGMFRLLPGVIAFWKRDNVFLTGYPDGRLLWDALTAVLPPTTLGIAGTLGWWEFDIYLGLIGVAVVAFFGIYLRFAAFTSIEKFRYRDLDGPLVVMAVLSMSYFYGLLAKLPIPLIDCERVPSRFLIIPVWFLIAIGCIRMNRVLSCLCERPAMQWLALAGTAQMAIEFVNHSRVWCIVEIERSMRHRPHFAIEIVAKSDPWYIASLAVGWGVSLLTIVVLGVYCVYLYRRTNL